MSRSHSMGGPKRRSLPLTPAGFQPSPNNHGPFGRTGSRARDRESNRNGVKTRKLGMKIAWASVLDRTLAEALEGQVVHLAPRDGSPVMECCGRRLDKVDLPKIDIATRDRDAMTCKEVRP
jgi:hypothetical protein